MNYPTSDYLVHRYDNGEFSEKRDSLTVEEPLEIRIQNKETGEQHTVAITMRTPGHDDELAVGFLFSEMLVTPSTDFAVPLEEDNRKAIVLHMDGPTFQKTVNQPALNRHFHVTSSCGVCGRTSLDDLTVRGFRRVDSNAKISARVLTGLPGSLRSLQSVFEKTGSLHAAALFELDGRIVSLREDVGRHNAVDKLLGERFFRKGLPLDNQILMVSGRLSYEILQKAVAGGIPIVGAISGPSDLAVKVAHEFGVTIVGFMRGDRFNIYTYPGRIGRP